MKRKLLNATLILTSVMAYLEWGHNNSMFLLTAERDIFLKLFSAPGSVLHPLILLPLAGQLLLLVTLFQKNPGKGLTFTGMGCLGLLLLFIFIIGIISLNIKIFASTLPFMITGIVTVISYRGEKSRGNTYF